MSTHSASLGRLAGWLLAAAAVGLVPWMLRLGARLPATATAYHWGIAWVGLDALLTAGCAGSASLLLRDARHGGRPSAETRAVAAATAATAALDCWFDLLTSRAGLPSPTALACGCSEVALVGLCGLIAVSPWGPGGDRSRPTGGSSGRGDRHVAPERVLRTRRHHTDHRRCHEARPDSAER